MSLTWKFDTEGVKWEQVSNLYKIAPLGEKPAEKLKVVFNNSMFKCFIFDDATLVGVGRALADGFDCSYICDVAVHPDFQGVGLGKQIINKLVSLSKDHKKIILYANTGKEAFYQKLGFKRMNTAMAIFDDIDFALEAGLVSET